MKAGIDYVGIATPFFCTDGKGNFLIQKRGTKSRDEPNVWEFGSGELEFGEDPTEGVLREVAEEYGCKGKILEQLPAQSLIRKSNSSISHWLFIPFIVWVDSTKAKNNEPEVKSEVRWARLDKLPQPFHSGFPAIYDANKKVFQKYS